MKGDQGRRHGSKTIRVDEEVVDALNKLPGRSMSERARAAVETPAHDPNRYTLVLIDAAGDDVADGDFVYVHDFTPDEFPLLWPMIQEDIQEKMAALATRPADGREL